LSFNNHEVVHKFTGVELVNTQGQTVNMTLELAINTRTDAAALRWRMGNRRGSVNIDRPAGECIVKAWRGAMLDSKRSRRFV
jgi:hypothetical protein